MSTSPVASAAAAAAAKAAAQVQQAAQALIDESTGSTVDTQSLVAALVQDKVAGQSAELTTQAGIDKSDIAGLASLSATLSGLQTALSPFLSGDALSSFSATLSGDGITAKAGQGAVAQTYQLDVTQVAQSQILTSQPFSTSDAAAMGSGTITISLGSGTSAKSFQVSVDSSDDSLEDIKNAINSASGNPGIKASIIQGANGASLSLQSTTPGAANSINVSVNQQTPTALSDLDVTSGTSTDPGPPVGASEVTAGNSFWTQTQAAQDAQLTVDGQLVTSSTNTISGAISGVTLTLDPTNSKTVGSQTLTVAPDESSVEGDLSSFVSAYNAVIDQLNSLAAPGTAGVQGTGGTLLGDEMINQLGAALGSIVGAKVSSGGLSSTLASLGINFQANTGGEPFAQLQIGDNAAGQSLDDVVSSDPAILSALFNDTNGLAQQLDSIAATYTDPFKGLITQRTTDLTADITSLVKQQDDLDDFAKQLTSQFNDQFTSLNTIMAQAQQNQRFLTQLFGGANSNGALAQNST
ncbi:flagellar filament capping protein FliD [Paraburkholderia sp. 2C]|jgi:flagellar hook-associated protein 2